MRLTKYIFSATLVAFGACQSWAQTSFLNAWAVNNPPLRNDFGNFVGMKFTVGSANLTVSSVGRLCVQGNTQNHVVKFVDGSNNQDVAGGAATVSMAGCTANQFVYQALSSPVTLAANGTYYVVSAETVGGDQWYDYGTVVSTADATVNSAIYFDGSNWNPLAVGSFSYVPPNFLYAGPPPPPPAFIQSFNTSATLRNDYSGFVGMQLTVGGTPLNVTQLGRICAAANSSQLHTVKFVDSTGTDVPGLSASVNMTGCTVGQYVYAPPSAAGTLQAGATYYLVSQEFSGGDRWYDFTSVAHSNVANITHAAYTAGNQYITISSANMSYVPPNFQYSTTQACPSGTISVTVGTSPPGLSFSVDGTNYPSTQTFSTWDCTKSHTIATSSPQRASGGTAQGFSSWSDGGTISHTVQPTTATTYTATFTTQYLLTTAANPPADGTVVATPASTNGYYNAGTTVQLQAQANSGYMFTNFTGDLSGTTNPQSITMSAPHSVAANFQVSTGPPPATFVTSFSTNATVRNDYGGFVGMRILTGASPIPVTALGRACLAGNSQTHIVKFVNAGNFQDVPGATATVNMAGCTPGTFVYAPPQSAVTLQPNTPYFLVSAEVAGSTNDTWYDLTQVTPNPAIAATVTNAVYSFNSSYIINGGLNYSYVVPNFQTGTVSNQTTQVTVNTSPSGLAFTVDGSPYTVPAQLTWVVGSTHTIATSSPQNNSGGTQQAFSSWNDGGTISHSVVVPATPTATYTATFNTQDQLTTNVSPVGGGTVAVSPASGSGFYDAGSTVQLTPTPNSGYVFDHWSGGASGNANPLPVTLNAATSITANFVQNGAPPNFIQTYTQNNLRTDFAGFVGMRITVGANPLNVSSVGRICAGPSNNAHIVKFAQVGSNTDLTNGSAIVNMSGCTPGVFRYTPLSVTLQPNTSYYLVSQESTGGDPWYDQGHVTSTNVASVDGAAYQNGPSYIFNGVPNISYVPPDFQYSVLPPPPPTFVTAYGSTGPALRNDFTGFVGMALTVGSRNLTVSQLGRACFTGNSQTHVVEFVDASNPAIIVGSANVNMSGCTPGVFVYAAPTGGAFTLTSGHSYYLASQETSGGDRWDDVGPVSTTSAAQVTSAIYQQGANWITNGGPNNSYVPPNFIYAVAGVHPLLTVFPSRAPNAFGSPSFAGWSANAINALQNSLTSIGDPASDPTAYFQVAQENNLQNIVSPFNSWLGLTPPIGPFASELGNRVHFGLHILGNGTQFSLSQLTFDLESDDSGNSFSQPGDFSTDSYSAQKVGIVHNGNVTTTITSGPGTQLVDELVYVGIGAALEPADIGCDTVGSNQAQLNCVAAFYSSISPFNLNITYTLNGISGAGSVHFVSLQLLPNQQTSTTLSPAPAQVAGESVNPGKLKFQIYK